MEQHHIRDELFESFLGNNIERALEAVEKVKQLESLKEFCDVLRDIENKEEHQEQK